MSSSVRYAGIAPITLTKEKNETAQKQKNEHHAFSTCQTWLTTSNAICEEMEKASGKLSIDINENETLVEAEVEESDESDLENISISGWKDEA